jgi:hypothetical protein
VALRASLQGVRRKERHMSGANKSVVRFGIIAVGKEFITVDQLSEAMRVQIKEDVGKKEHRPIGEILLSMGYMNHPQINEVLAELGSLFSES